MIVTVTCNPAIDVTYRVDRLAPGEVHRIQDVHTCAGGKGVNVARVLHQLGEATVATGFADDEFDALVDATGVPAAFVVALPAVRRTVVVNAHDSTTSLWEPGPSMADPRAASVALAERVSSFLVGASALVVSGSLPPGVDPSLPTQLAQSARALGVPVVLDLDEEPLRRAAAGSGAVLVPNLDELRHLVAQEDALDIVAAGRAVSRESEAPVVVTGGSSGMVAVDGDAAWRASLGTELEGNPTGAGDAAAAAIALGLAHARPWPSILRDAVALSASAVVAPVAGEVDLEAFSRSLPEVTVRQVETHPAQRR